MDWFNTDDYCRLQRSTQTQMRTHTITKRNVSRRWYKESKKTKGTRFQCVFVYFCVLRNSETPFERSFFNKKWSNNKKLFNEFFKKMIIKNNIYWEKKRLNKNDKNKIFEENASEIKNLIKNPKHPIFKWIKDYVMILPFIYRYK